MGNSLINSPGSYVSLFHSGEVDDLPKPFEQEIFLFQTFIAGTSRVGGVEDLVEHLYQGEELKLIRDPENWVDDLAIQVHTKEDVKLGFIPRIDNVIPSALMDAGKNLFARIMDMDSSERGVLITIDVIMRD